MADVLTIPPTAAKPATPEISSQPMSNLATIKDIEFAINKVLVANAQPPITIPER